MPLPITAISFATDYNGCTGGVPLACTFDCQGISSSEIFMSKLLVGGTVFLPLDLSDYTITDLGGNVFTATPDDTYAAGITIRVFRWIPYDQSFAFSETGPLPTAQIMAAFNRMEQQIQQLRGEAGLDVAVVTLPPGATLVNPTNRFADAAARALAVPAFIGQIGVQLDTGALYRGVTIVAGSWTLITTGAVGTVATGGTGVTSLTAWALLAGGTTGTGPVQQTGVGTLGQFLGSNGPGALPTFKTLAGGGDMLAANNLSDLVSKPTALTNLGGTTVGTALFKLANPSAITFPRLNADNSVTALSAADFRTAIAAAATANPLSQFAATTSAQLAGVISDETGTGLLVFGDSPLLTNPAIVGGSLESITIDGVTITNGIMVAPALGTIASGVGTALTALNASNLASGTVAPARLGSGSGGATKFLREDSTFQTLPGGGDALVASPLSQFAATTSAQLRGVMSDETGTGLLYFQGGDAGTPSAVVLTNATGLVTAGLADGAVTLAKMANLAQDQFIGRTTASTGVPQTATITAAARTVLDDVTVAAMVTTLGGAASTGTGGLVRVGSPSLTAPDIGAATGSSLALTGNLSGGAGTLVDGLTAGEVAGSTGIINLLGNASGTVGITVNDVAGAWTLTLPATAGSSGQALTTNGSGVASWASYATVASVANMVTAASTFAVDNRLLRSDGASRGSQATGWTVNDNEEASVTVDGAGEVGLTVQATGVSGTAIFGFATGVGGTAIVGLNTTGAGVGVEGSSAVSGGIGVLAKAEDATAFALAIQNPDGFYNTHTFAGTANRAVSWPDTAGQVAFASEVAAPPTIASAGTVAPAKTCTCISGVAAIATITLPAWMGGTGRITFIPLGAFTWTTAGNISVAGSAVVGKVLDFVYDSGTGKWNPSYLS